VSIQIPDAQGVAKLCRRRITAATCASDAGVTEALPRLRMFTPLTTAHHSFQTTCLFRTEPGESGSQARSPLNSSSSLYLR
jgi:hypothetical protein